MPRRGRVVWDDNESMGAAAAPRGTFPWMVSLFVLLKNGEALFMCAGTLLTPNIAVTAAHCFTNNEKKTTWFTTIVLEKTCRISNPHPFSGSLASATITY